MAVRAPETPFTKATLLHLGLMWRNLLEWVTVKGASVNADCLRHAGADP